MLGFYTPDSPYAKRKNNTFRLDKLDTPFAEHPRSSTVVSDVVTDPPRAQILNHTCALVAHPPNHPTAHLCPVCCTQSPS